MTKAIADIVLDQAIDYIIANGNGLIICSDDIFTSELPDYTKVTTIANLTAIHVLSAPDFTKSDGATSGRRAIVASQVDLSITDTGDAYHLCVLDTVNSVVLAVTNITVETLTSGGVTTTPIFDIELQDPSPY